MINTSGDERTTTGKHSAEIDHTTSSSGAAAAAAAPTPIPVAAGLAPGQVFAGRYRVVSALGRGGMGEVLRVDDLKLGQPAALKILPERLAHLPDMLERFHHEVLLARQVTHPAVCRVYDIGEHGGQHFLTMEYVDGEDLASLLRRIGRLPVEKALEIARALAAAVAAAHQKGVLHRDLKPSNIMLDGQGRVRVMDFGLAARPGEGEGVIAGTPSYMSPEQFDGRGVSPRSDVYALGLILFELLTGRRPLQADSFEQWALRHRTVPPPPPSSLVPDLDPALDALVLRCLAKAPDDRPASALAVAAALPGGDPLSAILAAGGTPSPELVASLADTDVIRLGPVAALAVGTVLLGTVCVLLGARASALRAAPLGRPPDALDDRAREVARDLGYAAEPVDTARQIFVDPVARAELNEQGRTGFFPVFRYVYRESPVFLEARWFRRFEESARAGAAGDARRHRLSWLHLAPGWVTRFDPPLDVPGMLMFELAPDGRVLAFRGVPGSGAAAAPADWKALFAAAGLASLALEPVSPTVATGVGADSWSAWASRAAGDDLQVTAASLRGWPVLFEVRPRFPRAPMRENISGVVTTAIGFLVLIAGLVLAPRNLRSGRADRKGAWRLALAVFTAYAVQWGLGASHVPTIHEYDLMGQGLSRAAYLALVSWLAYVTVEPYVRRRWPQMLVTWSRLLAGRFGDPAVARDVLRGGFLAALGVCVFVGVTWAAPWLGMPRVLRLVPPDELLGARHALCGRLGSATAWLVQVTTVPLCLVLARRAVRSEGVAALLVVAAVSSGTWFASPAFALGSILLDFLLVITILRFGLLAGVTTAICTDLMLVVSFASPVASWAASAWVVPLAALLTILGFALRCVLGGRDVARVLEP
jgi:predicted Ser/Thr protein kinase